MATISTADLGIIKFDFSDYYCDAILYIRLNRTLRLPDVADHSNTRSKLPPGLGTFETVATESLGANFPADQPAGLVMPMYQSEAVWFGFSHSPTQYPFLIKVGAGGINAITGDVWQDSPAFGVSGNQDYVTAPTQSWIDGFQTDGGVVRQFVAAPLVKGLTFAEQLRGKVKFGGIQFVVHPIDKEYFEQVVLPTRGPQVMRAGARGRKSFAVPRGSAGSFSSMGLAAGGQIEQQIDLDRYGAQRWMTDQRAALFVHITNSKDWTALTGRAMPREPLSARDYTARRGRWFDCYSETDTHERPANICA